MLGYQGKEDCIFNWSNRFLITYEVGFSYADDMCDGKLPYSQHFKSLQNARSHSGNAKLLMTRPTHRYAFGPRVQLTRHSICSDL